ncbi:hypothetical protein Tco_0863757 [Tanacetum coccineum]
MDNNQRSSKRQHKIPIHFHDSINDLNKKKDNSMNKGISVKNKKVGDCFDQANKECLGEDVSQDNLFENIVKSQEEASEKERVDLVIGE